MLANICRQCGDPITRHWRGRPRLFCLACRPPIKSTQHIDKPPHHDSAHVSRSCRECNGPIPIGHHRQFYCSDACRSEANRTRMRTLLRLQRIKRGVIPLVQRPLCHHCGTARTLHPSHVCARCRHTMRDQCECGHLKILTSKYCQRCFIKKRSASMRVLRVERLEQFRRVCPWCHGAFLRRPRSRDAATFCSRNCAFAFKKSAATLRNKAKVALLASLTKPPRRSPRMFDHVCPICSKSFQTRDISQRYCSRQCSVRAPKKQYRPRAYKTPQCLQCALCDRCFFTTGSTLFCYSCRKAINRKRYAFLSGFPRTQDKLSTEQWELLSTARMLRELRILLDKRNKGEINDRGENHETIQPE